MKMMQNVPLKGQFFSRGWCGCTQLTPLSYATEYRRLILEKYLSAQYIDFTVLFADILFFVRGERNNLRKM